jgi:hypothetical protein
MFYRLSNLHFFLFCEDANAHNSYCGEQSDITCHQGTLPVIFCCHQCLSEERITMQASQHE